LPETRAAINAQSDYRRWGTCGERDSFDPRRTEGPGGGGTIS